MMKPAWVKTTTAITTSERPQNIFLKSMKQNLFDLRSYVIVKKHQQMQLLAKINEEENNMQQLHRKRKRSRRTKNVRASGLLAGLNRSRYVWQLQVCMAIIKCYTCEMYIAYISIVKSTICKKFIPAVQQLHIFHHTHEHYPAHHF